MPSVLGFDANIDPVHEFELSSSSREDSISDHVGGFIDNHKRSDLVSFASLGSFDDFGIKD